MPGIEKNLNQMRATMGNADCLTPRRVCQKGCNATLAGGWVRRPGWGGEWGGWGRVASLGHGWSSLPHSP